MFSLKIFEIFLDCYTCRVVSVTNFYQIEQDASKKNRSLIRSDKPL